MSYLHETLVGSEYTIYIGRYECARARDGIYTYRKHVHVVTPKSQESGEK
jgi:hypothetical protein